jgi:acetyltransferase-like isoleucine patch superfamily enzyme
VEPYLRLEVWEGVEDHECVHLLGSGQGEAQGERPAERLADECRSPLLRGHGVDHLCEIGNQALHRLRAVAQCVGRHPVALGEQRYLAVEQLPGAVQPRHQHHGLARTANRQPRIVVASHRILPMSDSHSPVRGPRSGARWRIGVTALSIAALQMIVCGLAALPVLLAWAALVRWLAPDRVGTTVLVGILLVPSYVGFALCLMVVSALATRITGLRTPPDSVMPIADMEWRLMGWVHYMAATHVVRVLAGTLFRGSPMWTAYLRLNGARIGRRVYVNTLAISDHNLLEFGDDVVIGDDVHLSGHTVEAGIVKTGRVRLASDVAIGVGAVVGIGVVVGRGTQVGALSLVPKHTTLEPGHVYAGIPVRRLHSDREAGATPPSQSRAMEMPAAPLERQS